jgi:hypothetical protein
VALHIKKNLVKKEHGMAWHGASSGSRWGRWPPDMEGSCEYIEYKQLWTAEKMWSFRLGVGRGANKLSQYKPACYEMLYRTSELVGSFKHGNEFLGSIEGREFID